MDKMTMKLLHLTHCRGLGRKTIREFIRIDPQLQSVEGYTVKDLTNHFRLTKPHAESFLSDFHSFNPRNAAEYYEKRKIVPIAIHETSYPPLLKKIYDPPYLLYARGNIKWLQDAKALSVVGTRHPSAEAEKVMKHLLLPLIESGWVIVSGMALGVDGMAHRLAIQGRTIAVLGSGLFYPYPRSHLGLFRDLCNHQLVLSEYSPCSRPERWRFPERNRIISGLARGTLVVEAREKSGSLITADQALEQGREVFAVPGSILQASSAGTNGLIQQGAKLVMKAEDIMEELSGVY
ncbi:DNA-processing protein DprA [Sporolactobacillus pectinivorans]|uniref:DNA-processing protein DprA n=1 Tax=Sporolactobacillus pectinivorans TaxID=1591408 RepID=UPI000C25F15E|nr:DNA-processing protein DprA [Sporolactobacillus pectinivorans]